MANTDTVLKPFLIGGEPILNPEKTIDSINPATGELNCRVSFANETHVAAAVHSAKSAFSSSRWRSMLPHERARVLSRLADLMEARAQDFARLQMMENGKIWSECLAQAGSAASTFRYFAGLCETQGSEVTPARGQYLSMVAWEPYGVVAAITPWNSPLTMEAQKVAPALAAGNAVVLKPSEVTPSGALLLAEIAIEAGLPKGMLNVVTGDGPVTGNALVQHPDIRMVSFTGGTATGRHIAGLAAQRLIPVALELGGKSPHIIFEDAALDAAVHGVAEGIFEGSGQSCIAGSRLFVQRSVYDEVVERLVKKAKALRVGMPTNAGSQLGPLSSFGHRQRVERMVDEARAEGALILAGGCRPENAELAGGAFYLPTVIAGIDNKASIAQKEVFGPVLCVLPFDDEEDVIAQANDSSFGLAGGIWTGNYQRAWRVARGLETGLVWINTYKQLSIATPFGGFKESGIGREKGTSGIHLYQQSKGIYWSMNPANVL